MNWPLLFVLIVAYTGVFFLSGLIAWPGQIFLKSRFRREFGFPLSKETMALLSEEQRARWDRIYFHEFNRTPYRWIEVLCMLFRYPSILVLGALLKRETLNPLPMYFVDGTVYVALLYFFLR